MLFLAGTAAFAQERFGNIAGTATDPTKAAIPDVAVTITNKTSNRVLNTKTGADGTFRAQDVEPGRYTVRFEKEGFAKYDVPEVLVLLGKTARIDAAMQVGSLTQTVEVSEAAPVIDTTSTMIAHNVTAEEFSRLPKARTFQDLALFSTSVNTGQIEGGYQVNGASAAENNYYIDGVSTNSQIDGSSRQNAQFEYVQEVQVKTAGLEAEYGGALGGVVTAVTKSGGNEFHGEGHYYFDGNALSASPVQRLQLDPVNTSQSVYIQDEKQSRKNHEFGGSIGGPFIKNKLYFFTSASPRWARASNDYTFEGGEKGTMSRKGSNVNWFNKLSWDPTNRIRTNFTWLYTPTYSTGTLFGYNGMQPNASTSSLASAQGSKDLGFNQPENSLTGNIDFTLSNTSLLSVRGGRYYLNYKEVGVHEAWQTWFRTSSTGVAGVPDSLQHDLGYATPTAATTLWDKTTRTYVQADYSKFINALGQHNLKLGIGTTKNINNVNDSVNGPLGRVELYWDSAVNGQRGTYGYYLVQDYAINGSTGANITHMYVQDSWKVSRRLTLNLGLRTEKEIMPSFRRDVKDYAFEFGFGDKLAPRFGASYDVFGTGKLKISGAWGRFYDWTKYDLARGTFGGEVWHTYYRSLDTLDVFNLNLLNMPGRNLWAGEFRNRRVPGFQYLDPNLKPMSADNMNVGMEWELRPQTVFSARYVRNKLNRTIEDMGALDETGSEVYRYGNPGEGTNLVFPSSGLTCTVKVGEACGFEMPKPKRVYDAMELNLSRRFGGGWFANVSYVYSKLYGNYAGLQSTDEIRPPTLGYGSPGNQVFGTNFFRSGGNANRAYDLDEALWDAHGNVGLYGRLATDRPHVFKFYGSKLFRFGTEVGGFFRASSGTPVSTQVVTDNDIPVLVNGRGDAGRTPFFNQTDLVVAHEFKFGEVKKLRLEMNITNLFNQKTSMFTFDRYNREDISDTAGIYLGGTDLSKGFDWKKMATQTDAGAAGLDPRFGKAAIFNPGFSGRLMVKYIF